MMIILSHFYGQLLPLLLCMNHSRAEVGVGGAPGTCECRVLSFVCLSAGRSPPTLLNICLPAAQPKSPSRHLATLLLFI